uniref:Uncharacterized protein n=1 Tax=Anguilla anguilla TaxID=7936 RepID=A0A0E9RSL1_ANGAN
MHHRQKLATLKNLITVILFVLVFSNMSTTSFWTNNIIESLAYGLLISAIFNSLKNKLFHTSPGVCLILTTFGMFGLQHACKGKY